MNAEKYTQKTLDAVKTAQSMAQENGNQYLTPEHLLYALVDQTADSSRRSSARWAWTATACSPSWTR